MSSRAVARLVPAVEDRSGLRCEAVWNPADVVGPFGIVVGSGRCERRAVAIHHRLPRSRARLGDEHLLDLAGDADNLAHLCRECHERAHGLPEEARSAWCTGWWDELRVGLVVPGEVRRTVTGRLSYVGRHPEYVERVPELRVSA